MSTTLEGTIVNDRAPAARRLFGREPAAWVGLVEAVFALAVLFPAVNALGMTQEWATIILALVSAGAGVYTAWATRDTALGAILGFVKAGIGLVAYYGADVSTDQQAAILAASAVLFGFFQRTQTTPVDAPISPSPDQVVSAPTDPSPGAAVNPADVEGIDSNRLATVEALEVADPLAEPEGWTDPRDDGWGTHEDR